jgi:hypothetical protein
VTLEIVGRTQVAVFLACTTAVPGITVEAAGSEYRAHRVLAMPPA